MAAGETFAVFKPITYWAPRGTAIPDRSVPYEGDWPSEWVRLYDTVNGIQATFRRPKGAVVSEERGRLGSIDTGDEGITFGLQAITPTMDLLQKISSLSKTSKAATAGVQTLALTAGVTTNGTFTITLNGVTYSVTGATTASQGTAANLATYLKVAANYTPSLPTTGATGWTLGGSGSNVTFTAATSGARTGAYEITPGTTGVAGTFTQTTTGADITDIYALSTQVDTSFMLGFEGIATAGSLFSTRRWIRGIAYNVEATNNVEHAQRWKGVDAVFRPTMTLESYPALSTDLTAAIVGTDFTVAELDDDKRFNYFFTDTPAA